MNAQDTSPQVIPDLPFEDYCALDAVNASLLKPLAKSPAHCRARVDEDTASRGKLRAIHCFVLEPENFRRDFSLFDGRRDSRTNAYRAHLDRYPDTTVLNRAELHHAKTVAQAVRRHPLAQSLLGRGGDTELTIVWTDPETGMRCKARLDHGRLGHGEVWVTDLKTVGSNDARQLGAMAARLGWDIQAAHYSDGARIVYGVDSSVFHLVTVEDKPPYDVAVWFLEPDGALYAGEERRRDLMQKLAQCRRTNEWPGRYDSVQTLQLPSWAYPNDEIIFDHDTPQEGS